MPSIPSPPVMQLDPNDENIILSIPEDSGPTVKENASTLTPKKVHVQGYLNNYFLLDCLLKINFYILFTKSVAHWARHHSNVQHVDG